MSTAVTNETSAKPRAEVIRWLGKSFGALADQGLFSVANFLLNICLAGWLSATEYGAFSVGFTLFCFLGSLYTTLLVMPMLVFGAGRYRERVGDYMGVLLGAHVVFAVVAGVLLLIGAWGCWWYGSRILAVTLLSLACTQPCILLLWLCRRACYIRSEPGRAAWAGLAYLVVMLASLVLLQIAGGLSIPSVLAVMAIDSLVLNLWLLRQLGVTRPDRVPRSIIQEVLVDHWQYGRWSLPTTMINYVAFNIFVLLLPVFARMEDCGTLRALFNLIMPMLQVIVAMSILLLPQMVQTAGTAAFGRVIRLALLSMVGMPVLYWLVLGTFHTAIVGLVYHGHFTGYSRLLWLVGLLPVLEGLTVVPALSLQAHRRVDWTFWAALWSALGGLAVGVPLLYWRGLSGAIMGMALYSLFQSTLLWCYYLRSARDSHGSSSRSGWSLLQGQVRWLTNTTDLG